MTIEECYNLMGGDYEVAKRRLMSERLIMKYLAMFLEEPFMDELDVAIAQNDRAAAFEAVHKMKGVTANLAMTKLNACAVALTEQLRSGQHDPDPLLYKAVHQSYDKTLKAVTELCRA